MSNTFLTADASGPPFGAPKALPRRTLNIKRMLQLHFRLMIWVAVGLAVPSVLAVWLLVPTEYTANAEIRFLATTPRIMTTTTVGEATPYEKFLNTQIQLITGNTILSTVADDPDIRALNCFPARPEPLEYLKDHVTAAVQQNSELVTVKCTLRDRDSAKAVLEKVISQYLKYAVDEEKSRESERRPILVKERDVRALELTQLQSDIGKVQEAIEKPDAEGFTVREEDVVLYREDLVQAQDHRLQAEAKLARCQSELKRFEEAISSNKTQKRGESPLAATIDARIAADPRVATLQQELVRSEIDSEGANGVLVENTPPRNALEKRLKVLKDNTAKAEETVRGEIVETMRNECQERLQLAKEELDDSKSRIAKFGELLKKNEEHRQALVSQQANLDRLNARKDEVTNIIHDLQRQINEIDIEGQAPARVRQPSSQSAGVGGSPNSSRRYRMILLALVLSAGIGISLGVTREVMDRQVRLSTDLSYVTNLPVVATIPQMDEDKNLSPVSFSSLVAERPNSMQASEFRRMLTSILYPSEGKGVPLRSVLVTSPTKGDGKTVLVCNLAAVLAEAGRRVLLVDLNSSHAGIEHAFHLDSTEGLAEILSGERLFDELVRPTSTKNIWVLGPGKDGARLAGKLASKNMVDFLEQAEEKFDNIVFDSPPSLLLWEGHLLAPLVDGVVVAIGAGRCNIGMAQRCLRNLDQMKANVIGVVLNGVRIMRGGYLKDNLDMYYGYLNGHNGKHSGNGSVPKAASEEEKQAPAVRKGDLLTFQGKLDRVWETVSAPEKEGSPEEEGPSHAGGEKNEGEDFVSSPRDEVVFTYEGVQTSEDQSQPEVRSEGTSELETHADYATLQTPVGKTEQLEEEVKTSKKERIARHDDLLLVQGQSGKARKQKQR